MRQSPIVALMLLLSLTACHGDAGVIPLPTWPAAHADLMLANGCAQVSEALVQQQLYNLDVTLHNAEVTALQQGCMYIEPGMAGGATTVSNPATNAPAASASGATQVSSTNVQVAGVDEPDFVKNDNQYIYMLAKGAFHIVNAYPAASMRTVASVPVNGDPRELFVDGDTAIVYVATGATNADANPWTSTHCTYGYACEPTGDGTQTTALVFDIHDRTAPVQTRAITVPSAFISARRVNNAVYTVLSAAPATLNVPTWPDEVSCNSSPSDIISAFARLRAADRAQIMAQLSAPNLAGSDSANPGTSLTNNCSNFYLSPLGDGATTTSLLAFDLSQSAIPTLLTVVGRPGFTYATDNALYLAQRHSPTPSSAFDAALAVDPNEVSTVYKFALDANHATATYVATGVIPGHVIDQFSMDDMGGVLRTATSLGMVADTAGDYNSVSSSVTTLTQQGNQLVRLAGIDHIAPGEDIRAVRFDGNRGYVCTFKKTDPLFVFNLQEPSQPTLLSEVQVPGFSTYMQMMDANHLLTIGFDADDEGTFALFEGIRLQIFDVTDPTNARLAFSEDIGTRGSSSAALTNHLAFNYFAAENLLAIPVTICGNTSPGTTATFNGLRVYQVTAQNGFVLQGDIPLASAASANDAMACWNWWSNANSLVQRSVIMDTDVYAISPALIQVDALGSLGTDISTVAF